MSGGCRVRANVTVVLALISPQQKRVQESAVLMRKRRRFMSVTPGTGTRDPGDRLPPHHA